MKTEGHMITIRLSTKQFQLVMRALTRVGGEHLSDTHTVLWSETFDVLLDAVSGPSTCSALEPVFTSCESICSSPTIGPTDAPAEGQSP